MDAAKPNLRKRSPTEDKQLSLARDRRNTYGNSDKAARKGIRRFKAASTKAGRHGAKQVVASAGASFDEAAERRLSKQAWKSSHPVKKKAPDTPLREVIAQKKRKRVARTGRRASRSAQ